MLVADRVSPDRRSAIMAKVGTRDTGPELAVRQMLHALGYRYRLHQRSLPGSPDLAFPARTKAIFINGCFWHGHGCRWGQLPKSRLDYWGPKIAQNRRRDETKRSQLRKLGWRSLVVWQCELRTPGSVLKKVLKFLEAA
jgi:DNA mismatch endonuclease (patch repair protein)